MKNLRSLMLLLAMLTIQISFAQNTSRLKLSNPYPENGEKVTFTYDPTGTPLAEAGGKIEGTTWFIENNQYPSTPVTIQPDGKLYKGEFTVSAGAKAFFIKINSGKVIDNNEGRGYISIIYQSKKPIEGAHASNAFILSSGIGAAYANITRNADEAATLYNKEFEFYPQSKKKYEQQYYAALSQNPANKDIVNKKIAELKQSKDENDVLFARSLLRSDTAAYNALTKEIKARYPDGTTVMNDVANAVAREKDIVKKDSLFKSFLAKYPAAPANLKNSLTATMLSSYLKNGDMASYDKYSAQVTDKLLLAQVINNVVYGWATNGEKLAEAEKLSKQTIDYILANYNVVSPNALTKENVGMFTVCGDTYAYILWKEKKFAEAVEWQSMVYAGAGDGNTEVVEHYVQMLNDAKQNTKAFEIAERNIRMGKSNAAIETEFKKAYPLVKGSMAGFESYWADVQKNNLAKKEQEKKDFEAEQAALLARQNSESSQKQLASVKKDLSNKMIKEPAPLFTLKDLSGKAVSLASLKGKTVIIDFWATWCGPCIMSFPGMQIAQNKYKNNPDVVFLFIDAWENGSDYLPGVKKFIADKGYSFHVLVDETGADKRQSKVISTFKVEGIPTKFIIDKNGDIRFKYVGYTGSTEGVVNEVTAMIELLDDPIAKTNMSAPGKSATGSTLSSPTSISIK